MADRELTDLQLTLHATTARAYLVSDSGDEEDAVWVPRSEVEMDETVLGRERGRPVHEFTMPQWLAEKKGLV